MQGQITILPDMGAEVGLGNELLNIGLFFFMLYYASIVADDDINSDGMGK